MDIHFVIHEAFEGAGYLEHWANERGYKSHYSRVYLGDALPTKETYFDCLIILGGPQNPLTNTIECSYFDSTAEQVLIRNAIDDCKIVIGVCLGAQLIGEALGAKHEKSPHKEIGYFPIQLTEEGRKDPLLQSFGSSEVVGHWHNDMPGLTNTAQVLAVSAGCPRQIVRYSDFVYGFQCHLEFMSTDLDLLIDHSANDFINRESSSFVQAELTITSTPTRRMNLLLSDFLDKMVVTYLRRYY
ncbi:glutamine amidotransferase-related protein [Shewanella frigidimarina]|uniref:glutamine amidotransferase-related protein n=1 Tax=Shewanella frigidimarina TaxID=56812 RepID=UPI003D7C077B